MDAHGQKKLLSIADVFKAFGKKVDGNHYQKAHKQYRTLSDHARYLAKSDKQTHDALMSYYEENEQIYPACLSDDQKQICLPLYDFLCSAGTVFDLTNVWPTYVFLVEVYNRQRTILRKNDPHLNKSGDYISNILQCMKTGMEEEILKTANTEYLNLLGDERQMKRNPDLAREKELWVLNGDVAAQKFLDNIEYMDRALYRTIKEAVLRNVEGSQIAWCQYGSLLHSSELLKRDEQQMARRSEKGITDLQEQCEELERQNAMKSRKIEELSKRLCEVDKLKVTKNSNNADVNDSDEMNDIGKKFSDVYNNEWVKLFDSLKSEIEDETARIEKLCGCLLMAFKFCKEESEKQMNNLQVATTDVLSFRSTQNEENEEVGGQNNSVALSQEAYVHLQKLRKQCYSLSLPKVRRMFRESCTSLTTTNEAILRDFEAYLTRCVDTCWYMCIQDPPLNIKIPEKGDTLDTKQFNLYKSEGDIVDICVWPALLLGGDDSTDIVCKGQVLTKLSKTN